jgi:tRNA(adenine34) deaminase
MCMGAILNSRIKRLVFAAGDNRAGCCGSLVDLNEKFPYHKIEVVSGVLAEESSTMLRRFFQNRRAENDKHTYTDNIVYDYSDRGNNFEP